MPDLRTNAGILEIEAANPFCNARDRGFVLSDHADWPELNTAIRETGAETVYVTHGFSQEFTRWLNETGMNAVTLKTKFVGDDAPEMMDEESENAPDLT